MARSMTAAPRRVRPIWRWLNLLVAALVTAGVLLLATRGGAGLPPLGAAFVPGHGIWTDAAGAKLPTTSTLHLAGLQQPASVVFEHDGVAHIRAATDHDLWLVNGYLDAHFRLVEMDLLRRQGEGLLSQVVGPAALGTDRFQLKLGLLRTARATWHSLPTGDPGRAVLLAYSTGVNDGIKEDESRNQLPMLFSFLNYRPARWTPIDTLVVQGDETETLDFDDGPLIEAALGQYLGDARVAQWFPAVPPNAQVPYDPGPYRRQAPASIPAQTSVPTGTGTLAEDLSAQLAALPAGLLHDFGASNAWVVSGKRTASGHALLAGDPHLHQTLPAIWYQFSGDSPDYHFTGVGIPGTPGIIIGHNQHIAWSLTDTQNRSTIYYVEGVDHQHRYSWRSAWHPERRIVYHIPVKGQGTSRYEVDLTDHGPIFTDKRVPGEVLSIWWAGALPSRDIDALLGVMRAGNWGQFKSALRVWHVPTQNFAYADDRGNIGIIAPGYYPIVRAGNPAVPLPGDGSSDVIGTIPFSAVPQTYDPPSGFAVSANQRPVGAAYPYNLGGTLDTFDPGYRAATITNFLSARHRLTAADMAYLQNDVQDGLAVRILPRLLADIPATTLTPLQRQARAELQGWNGAMTASSLAAAIWYTFWTHYRSDVFEPWWQATRVPSKRFGSLKVGNGLAPLDEDLEHWTLQNPANPAFSLPHGKTRRAGGVMRLAFIQAVQELSGKLGSDPAGWKWGRLHTREFPSLAGFPGLGYGPRAAGGDGRSVDAADGYPNSDHGPSWRFIMDWGTGTGEGVYPGGQSENPQSPWYENLVSTWWESKYDPLSTFATASTQSGHITWTVKP